MEKKISPWSATAQENIRNSDLLLEKILCDYTLRVYVTGDSVWIVCLWPDSGQMAFRAAFGMGSNFEVSKVIKEEDVTIVRLVTHLGKYEIEIFIPDNSQSLFHYRTRFTPNSPLLIPYHPRDIIPLTISGKIVNTSGKIHVQQVGARSGLLFGSMTKPKTGSFFYFQNLTALSEYCEITETNLTDSVGGEWPEIGFQLPPSKEIPLVKNKTITLSDAYIFLTKDIIEDEVQLSRAFLNQLAAIYKALPKPELKYNDWPKIASNVRDNLHQNKGCWIQKNGVAYLNAYLCDYKTPPESMVQLAVLTTLNEYQQWSDDSHPLYEMLNRGISSFYDPKVKTINRWLPSLADHLDESEEQKKEMVMDSWYLHHPLMNLTRLALTGDKTAEKLVMESIEFVIKVAHHFNYQWPVFYNLETLKIIKKETEPGEGGEKDVPGSYAHLMLLVYKLTKKSRFFKEAEKAVKALVGEGLDVFYQANNTAFSAGALLEMYKITGKQQYLDLSYICLAGIFRNVQLWDCQYGFGKHYNNFFAVFPLNDAPYTSAYEEMEVYTAFTHYLEEAENVDILPSLRTLLPEFVKYAVGRIASYYPSELPEDMLSKEVKTGEIQRDLWVPLEDLYTGWEPSGQVGQEIYGAGIAFGIVPRHYYKVDSVVVFVDYPVTKCTKNEKSMCLTLDGDSQMTCSLIVFYKQDQTKKLKVSQNKKQLKIANSKKAEGAHYVLSGNGLVEVMW